LAVDGRQGKLHPWLSMAAKKSYILGGCKILLAHLQFWCKSTLLGGQIAKKIILGGWQPRKLDFIGSLFLADFAWRPAAKDHFLGGFGAFLGVFWPPR